MSVNEDLRILISQINSLEAIPTQEEIDGFVAACGSFRSIPLLEAAVKFYKAKRDMIERTDIPCVLAEHGLQKATMEDGTEVSISTFYETRQGDKGLLAQWVLDHGYGDIIKDTLAFSKGEVDEKLMLFLSSEEYTYSRDSSINPQTLKKVLRDHVEGGGELPPPDAVTVSIFDCAVVKRPKEKF